MSGYRFKSAGGFRKPTRTKIGQKIALMQCILARDSFTERDIEGLSRSYGYSVDDIRAMIADKNARRGIFDVGAV